MSVPINPETRVGALLEAYPALEDVLIAAAPAFANLKNPILRKTVAKVATLEQAARIGGIGVRELVEKLRQAAGLQLDAAPESGSAEAGLATAPSWLSEERVRHTIDADSMLAAGEHPIGKVRQLTAGLEPGQILRLTSSFRPAPLIDTMSRAGLAVYSTEISPGRHVTYLMRP